MNLPSERSQLRSIETSKSQARTSRMNVSFPVTEDSGHSSAVPSPDKPVYDVPSHGHWTPQVQPDVRVRLLGKHPRSGTPSPLIEHPGTGRHIAVVFITRRRGDGTLAPEHGCLPDSQHTYACWPAHPAWTPVLFFANIIHRSREQDGLPTGDSWISEEAEIVGPRLSPRRAIISYFDSTCNPRRSNEIHIS